MTWITVNEAAIEVQRSSRTIRVWASKGLIKKQIKNNGKAYVLLEEVKKMAESRKPQKTEYTKLQQNYQNLLTQYDQALKRIDYYQKQLENVKLLESRESAAKRRMEQLEKDLNTLKSYVNSLQGTINKYENQSFWDRVRGKKYDFDEEDELEEDYDDDYDDDDEDY